MDPTEIEPIELESRGEAVLPAKDRRRFVPEPLPVRLLTVDDATLISSAGLEVQLDAFYVSLLKFEREQVEGPIDGPVYRADNFRLRFQIIEMLPERETLRPLLIEVQRLSEIEHELITREIEYTRQRGITPGEERLVLRDPAGNWVEIVECRAI